MPRTRSRTSSIESYVAHARAATTRAAVASAFKIEVRFLGGLSASQKSAFKSAADRWSNIIIGDVPSVMVGGEVIDDLLIEAKGEDIDGVGGILGQAGPTHLRPVAAGRFAQIPVKGVMAFDTADLEDMESGGTLTDVITHEMGHVLGIGTIWDRKGLLRRPGSNNPTFVGAQAKAQYGKLRGTGPRAVPVENQGGPGTRDGHWRESIFRNELMSGFIQAPNNPLSAVTAASLADMGYVVDMKAAEPFALADLMALAESGQLLAKPHAHTLPVIPMTLPNDSLR